MQTVCLAISCVNSLSSVYPIVLKCLRKDKGVSMHREKDALRDVHTLTLGTLTVAIPGERDFADWIMLKSWRWGDFPELSG